MSDERKPATIEPEAQLRNVADCVMSLTTPNPQTRGWNRKRPNKTYAAAKQEIAEAAHQLAEMVLAHLEGKLEPIAKTEIPL